MQLYTITSFSFYMNQTMNQLNNDMYYLEDIAELKKVSPSIKHQSAETNPWKWHIPMKTQIYHNRHKNTGELQPEH